jgi:hypothetical protein
MKPIVFSRKAHTWRWCLPARIITASAAISALGNVELPYLRLSHLLSGIALTLLTLLADIQVMGAHKQFGSVHLVSDGLILG